MDKVKKMGMCIMLICMISGFSGCRKEDGMVDDPTKAPNYTSVPSVTKEPDDIKDDIKRGVDDLVHPKDRPVR